MSTDKLNFLNSLGLVPMEWINDPEVTIRPLSYNSGNADFQCKDIKKLISKGRKNVLKKLGCTEWFLFKTCE